MPVGRARLDVGPADVGRRLTIRYKGEGLARPEVECVGVLYRWTGDLSDGILRIRKRDGAELGIRLGDIVAMRVVPPEASAYSMQRLAQEGWPPLETAERGSWLLRASRGATGRANSVRVGGRPRNLEAALEEVTDWYGQHGLPPKLQLPTPSGLSDDLDRLGWTGRRTSRLLVNSVPRLLNASADAQNREDLDIGVQEEPNGEWLRLAPGYNEATAPEFDHALAAVRPAAFVYCRNVEGTLLGIGHATLQGSWCGATTIQTTPQARRGGIASAVVARLAQWAADNEASHWYLQLFEDNAAALSFWERMGFTTHHHYEYRWPGDAAEQWGESET